MVLFFAAYFPLLNALVSGIHGRLFKPRAQEVAPGLELEPPGSATAGRYHRTVAVNRRDGRSALL
jgi:hypothetical protein